MILEFSYFYALFIIRLLYKNQQDTISGKATNLKILQNEQEEGQGKLDKAFQLAEQVCELAGEEDKEVIEEEVAFLQDEFDKFL